MTMVPSRVEPREAFHLSEPRTSKIAPREKECMEVGGRALQIPPGVGPQWIHIPTKGLGRSCIPASFPGPCFAQVSDACLIVWKSTLAYRPWVQVTAEIQSEASR